MQIDPTRRGVLPEMGAPVPFSCRRGSVSGWKVAIPGGHPLATPAVAQGRLFLGGGFGSYEFYCLNAETGEPLWQYQTNDDGPTAAVVEDQFVAFNTESCELEVLTVDGKAVWKHWLGDPLMSMPAIANGRVFMAYPDTRHGGQYYLACFDVAAGQQLWRTPIVGEIITAPVLAEEKVFCATLDGTLYCCRQSDGSVVWHEGSHATSSPVVVDGQCYFSQRKETRTEGTQPVSQQTEQCAVRGSSPRAATREYGSTRRKADYLDHAKRRFGSAAYASCDMFDAHVGFGMSKGSAQMFQAMANLGHAHVSSLWAYQGSKPFHHQGRLYSSLGDTVHCVDLHSEQVIWKHNLFERSADAELLDSVVTPPVLVNNKVFVGTADGTVVALDAQSGTEVWRAEIDEPIQFQPSVVAGRVYVPTHAGTLYCLETGDPADDGWCMWGASPAHNGLDCCCAVSAVGNMN